MTLYNVTPNNVIKTLFKKFGLNDYSKLIINTFRMKKIPISISVEDAQRIILTKMCPVPNDETFSLADAYEEIKLNLPKKLLRVVDENYIKTLLDKQVIRNIKVDLGTSVTNKSILRYKVYKQDVDNYCLMLQISQLQDYIGLSAQSEHPETGKKIEVLYTPSDNKRLGMNKLTTYTGCSDCADKPM